MSTKTFADLAEILKSEPNASRPSGQVIHKGLAGVVITESEICKVDGERGTLTYRGYDIGELACHASYEEVVYLLWYGTLPTRTQLNAFSRSLIAQRNIDGRTWQVLRMLPEHVDPMDALRTAVTMFSCTESDDGNRCRMEVLETARHLVAAFPTVVANYYRYRQGLDYIPPNPNLSHTANFLYMLNGAIPTSQQQDAINLAMLLMSEHGFNASTFAARVTASTLSDIYSAVTTAIGTLKGALHGGANRRAMEMMLDIGSLDNVANSIEQKLAAKQLIMGFGHRVYKNAPDPRSAYLRGKLYELCAEKNDFYYYQLATAIADYVETRKGLYPNVDFYCASVMYMLGIPLELFVPVFAISRVPGWIAHITEQYDHNRIIRPLSAYVGPASLSFIPIDERIG